MLKKKTLSPKQQHKHNFSLGKFGEQSAVRFLEQKGYQILDKNVCFKNKEIDIVAIDKNDDELVFIEVKTRNKGLWGDPSQAVNKRKLRSMEYVAHLYLQQNKLDLDYRFDIITMVSGRIRHYRNITW